MIRSTVALRIHRLAFCPTVLLCLLMLGRQSDAAEFYCPSGNVTCLIASINEANTLPGQHIIDLEPGNYTLQAIDNETLGANGLPIIKSALQIKGVDDDLPTVIERDPAAPIFRIFSVSPGAELILDGITVQRGGGRGGSGLRANASILNDGTTSLYNSVVRDSFGEGGAIGNNGRLNIIKSVIADNIGLHLAGGILNNSGGNLLVENSTIAGNFGIGPGGISNFGGSVLVKNSAIVFNSADEAQPGGGIGNFGGSVEIVNTTIAKNSAGVNGGGGVYNCCGGLVSITNSTIRENTALGSNTFGAGIFNETRDFSGAGGTVQIKNTIVAGNTFISSSTFSFGPDCRGLITTLGNNLLGDPNGCNIDLKPTDLTGDPGLGSLVEMGEDDSPGHAFYPVSPGSVVINRADPVACPAKDQLGNPRVGTCDIGAIEFQGKLLVSVDIRPRSDANKVNPSSNGNINVALFGGDGFDATTLDPSTIRFGAKGSEASPVNLSLRDVDGDGERDVVLRFEIQNTGIECGDTSATLTGEVSGGQSFIGSARITTTGCKPPKTKNVS